MHNKKYFSDEIIEKFADISEKLYNIKYSLELLRDEIEQEPAIPLNLICTFVILKEYFDKTKEDYNSLEKELGILV